LEGLFASAIARYDFFFAHMILLMLNKLKVNKNSPNRPFILGLSKFIQQYGFNAFGAWGECLNRY